MALLITIEGLAFAGIDSRLPLTTGLHRKVIHDCSTGGRYRLPSCTFCYVACYATCYGPCYVVLLRTAVVLLSTATMATDYTTDERFLRAARRGQHGVHVPRRWRDVLSAAEYAQLVVLLSMRSRGARHVTVGQAKIAEKLGRDPGARLEQVGRVTARLVEAGAVATSRVDRGTGRTRYEFLDLRGHYDVVPWAVLRALAAGECTAGELRTWAYVTGAMMARGWTSDSSSEIADRVGVNARTIRRHVDVLAGLGVLRVQRVPAASGLWMLERVDDEPQPAGADLEDQTDPTTTGAVSGAVIRSEGIDEVVEKRIVIQQGPDTDVGSALSLDVGSYRDLPPERVLTPDDIPPSSRSARHLSDRASSATSGRTRPTGGIYSIDGINDVVDLLEQDRAWKWGARRRWLNGILAQTVAPALERGLTPQAIAHCLTSPSVAGDLDEAAELQQPLIAAARNGLTALAIDTRLGDACRDCGRSAFDADQTRLTRGRCDWCHEQHAPASAPSVENLVAALSKGCSR